MQWAIHLDYQAARMMDEVHDEATDGCLAPNIKP